MAATAPADEPRPTPGPATARTPHVVFGEPLQQHAKKPAPKAPRLSKSGKLKGAVLAARMGAPRPYTAPLPLLSATQAKAPGVRRPYEWERTASPITPMSPTKVPRTPAPTLAAPGVPSPSRPKTSHWARHGVKEKPLDSKFPYRNKGDANLLREVKDRIQMTGASLPDTHRKYFDRFDVDENGKVCRDEFKQGVKSMGLGLNDEELDRLATIVDTNNDDHYDMKEFLMFADSYQPLEHIGEDPDYAVYGPWDTRVEPHEYTFLHPDDVGQADQFVSQVKRGRGPAPRNFYLRSREQESKCAVSQRRHAYDQVPAAAMDSTTGRHAAYEEARARRGGFGVGGGSGGESAAELDGAYPQSRGPSAPSYVVPSESSKAQQRRELVDMDINKALASKVNGLDENKLERIMKGVFHSLDINGDGTVSVGDELIKGLRLKLNLVLTDEQNKRLCQLMDANGDGEIDWPEFANKVFGSSIGVLDKGGKEVGSLGGEASSVCRRPPPDNTDNLSHLPAKLKEYDAGTVPTILGDHDSSRRRELDALITRVLQRPGQLQRNLSEMDINGDGIITTGQAEDAIRRLCPEWGSPNPAVPMAEHRMQTSSGKFSSTLRTAVSNARAPPVRHGEAIAPVSPEDTIGNPLASPNDTFVRYPRRQGVENSTNVCASPDHVAAQGTVSTPSRRLPEESVNAFAALGGADAGHYMSAGGATVGRGWHGNAARISVIGATDYPDQVALRRKASTAPGAARARAGADDSVDTATLLVSAADPKNSGVVRYRDLSRFIKEVSEESGMHLRYRMRSNATRQENPEGFWGMRGYRAIQNASDAATPITPTSPGSTMRRTGPCLDRHYLGALPVPRPPPLHSSQFKFARAMGATL